MRPSLLAGVLACSALVLMAHCDTAPLDLGSAVLWSTDSETGDLLSAWMAAPGSGGSYLNSTDAVVALTTEQHHSGGYAIKITSTAASPTGSADTPAGGGLYKLAPFPSNAYYSAWYYVPQVYQTSAAWTIMEFGVPGDAGGSSVLIEIRLQSEPSGDTTLVVFDHRPLYSTAPLPNPPPSVPIGRWFQLESFYQRAGDSGGHLTIWLDGAQVYDLPRAAEASPLVYFSACSLANDLVPTSAELYIDDVAVSLVPVTPHGTLQVP